MNKLRHCIYVFLAILLISGCSEKAEKEKQGNYDEVVTQEEPTNEEMDADNGENGNRADDTVSEDVNEVEAAPLPRSLEELAERMPGYTAHLSFSDPEDLKKIDELTRNLSDISGKPSENELDHFYNELLALFQQDFMGPEDLIAKLKFQGIGNPNIGNPRMQFKEALNVLVILDSSGSMGKDIGGQTQMAAAKKAIVQFVEELPQEANVGLRVYGHKGTGSAADKGMSCSSSDLLFPLQSYDKSTFQQSLEQVKPAGWTPTELALKEAQMDLASFKGESNTNIVYLVSDGVSTCDDDPVAAAQSLYDSDITPIINVIGFNVDHEGQRQLKTVAKAVGGMYQDVQNAKTLQNELNRAKEVAKNWADWKKKKGEKLEGQRISNGLDIFIYDTKEETKIVDEMQRIGSVIQYLYLDKKNMSRESHDYLRKRNKAYHDWVQAEYNALREELKNINEMQYEEGIQALEEKYLQHTAEKFEE
ncbi:Ca-activated chloride channel family protein [Sporosarcina luteola]|nr:Ca-activated chloride channel family protein [Sporosarcina luteola]